MKFKTNQTTYQDGDFIIIDMCTGDVARTVHSFTDVDEFLDSLCDWRSYAIYRYRCGEWKLYGVKFHICHIDGE